MPPREECPICHVLIEDWHVEWYDDDTSLLFRGAAAMDCPLCGQLVGFQRGQIGTAPPGVSVIRRRAAKAAEWAVLRRWLRAALSTPICPLPAPASSTRCTGRHNRSSRRTQRNRQKNRGLDMNVLTPQEVAFLDVFLHEATTSPFTGPATRALHGIAVEYKDISYIAWAYNREVPKTSHEWGHAAESAPPLPWHSRQAALIRDKEIEQIWHQERKPSLAWTGPKTMGTL